ncbi:hypothetical protein AVEN_207109-1 [Araneus ventricosus]|uniref:Uncharacterized protein n=1 Tax=Araneus ventricosus TaxID=182803 RepID=A0A4Y2CEM6_ARAVE|nr:hypothetical protein AVEN_207109-1 [Araneus ventricosus]
MIFQCSIALYSIKTLPRRRHRPLSMWQCLFSPDLTPCDFLPSGYFVHLHGVPALTTLKDNISLSVLSIPGDMSRSAVENVVYGMQCVVHEKVGDVERGL